jgi:hypothetical protein
VSSRPTLKAPADGLRPVAALSFADIEPGGADMARPKYVEVDPTSLLVDESYQRNLSERSRRLHECAVGQARSFQARAPQVKFHPEKVA